MVDTECDIIVNDVPIITPNGDVVVSSLTFKVGIHCVKVKIPHNMSIFNVHVYDFVSQASDMAYAVESCMGKGDGNLSLSPTIPAVFIPIPQ